MHQQKSHCDSDNIYMVLQVVEDTMHIGAETAVTLKAQVNLGWTLDSIILFNIPMLWIWMCTDFVPS